MAWEDQFYEDGVAFAGRIREMVAKVPAEKVAALAVEAREKMKLRHAPLMLVREMARLATHRHLVAATLTRVVKRADELSEFVALYWSEGRQPLSAQVKKGLAAAFTKFDEYALAKYNRASPVKLRDVLFLCHAKPVDSAQAGLWKRLVEDQLAAPHTWEVALSAGADRRQAWQRLLSENKLGALALLCNLRNMAEARVPEHAIRDGLARMSTERAAVSLHRCGALRAAVGSGARAGDVPGFARSNQRGPVQAAGQDRAAGGRLRLHGRAAFAPVRDAPQ